MKRPSIHDPRVPSVNAHRQLGRLTPDARIESGQHTHPSLLVKLPVEARTVNNKASVKRKRVEDAPTQRVIRPKLTDDTVAVRKPFASVTRNNKVNEENAFVEPVTLASSNDATAPPSPTHKTYGKQKPAMSYPAQQAAPQASSSRSEQDTLPVAKPAVSAVKSRKAISKPKPAAKDPVQQQTPAQAAPSSSKAPATVKREAKGPRQPAGACKSCRSRHQKCDRTHPTCGRCAKTGVSCEYPVASNSTASSGVPTTSPRKKQALLPLKKSTNEANREHDLRERSVTVSPEAPRQKSPPKRPMPTSLSKKSTVAAVPTAASARVPRAKKTQNPRASPQK